MDIETREATQTEGVGLGTRAKPKALSLQLREGPEGRGLRGPSWGPSLPRTQSKALPCPRGGEVTQGAAAALAAGASEPTSPGPGAQPGRASLLWTVCAKRAWLFPEHSDTPSFLAFFESCRGNLGKRKSAGRRWAALLSLPSRGGRTMFPKFLVFGTHWALDKSRAGTRTAGG